MTRRLFTSSFARLLVVVAAAAISPRSVRADADDYAEHVKPILKAHCYSCHGPLKQKGGLRVDTAALLRAGGDGGPAIKDGDASSSLLVHALEGTNDVERMPQKGKPLNVKEIAAVRAWITRGAKGPADEEPAKNPRDHWAFMPPIRPELPKVTPGDWAINPIDTFISAKHEQHGLRAQGDASRGILLRRLYLDLIGLPPTPQQMKAFASDSSPKAYENIVDQLLASKQFGERWGRHWMDVWRYSDWYGYKKELRASARFIWRWRDWIVESLNEGKPYNDMIIEMLAADEAKPLDRDALRATGFLVRNYYKFNRDVWLDATVEHTGKAFLGITMNCAKCHDHMYDPISQVSYYEFRAIFEPYGVRTDRVPGQPDVNKDGLPHVFDEKMTAATYLYERGNDKLPRKDQKINPAYPQAFGGKPINVKQIDLPAAAFYPGLQKFAINELVADAKKKRDASKAKLESLKKQSVPDAVKIDAATSTLAVADATLVSVIARVAAEQARFANPQPKNLNELRIAAADAVRTVSRLKAKRELSLADQALASANKLPNKDKATKAKRDGAIKAANARLAKAKKSLASLAKPIDPKKPTYPFLSGIYPSKSTGRRLALANWITSKQNPLTARVAVNHIWARHFGKPLVSSTFDFGMNGSTPSHPKLLDWLAIELMDSDWNLKHIHRLIVTCRTYRMRSTSGSEVADSIAAENQYYTHMNPRRLEGEAVRDALLSVAGKLDRKMGGADLDHTTGMSTYRRSLYYRHAMEKQMSFLQLFDAPSPNECYRRPKTIVPQQALAMANSPLAIDMSRVLATKLSQGVADDAAFIDLAFKRILCRRPNASEQDACIAFLAEQVNLLKSGKGQPHAAGASPKSKPASDPKQRAREGLIHVLFNHHEFVTIR